MQVFPRVAPVQGTMTLAKLQDEDPHIQAGEGRTLADQALMQLLGNTQHLSCQQNFAIFG